MTPIPWQKDIDSEIQNELKRPKDVEKRCDLKDKAEAIQMTFYGQKSNNYTQAAHVQKVIRTSDIPKSQKPSITPMISDHSGNPPPDQTHPSSHREVMEPQSSSTPHAIRRVCGHSECLQEPCGAHCHH
ncbi:hypothetical protein CEXT_809311 [Caerostris extrusa]|uniref:Uncharacterized protein n=1 Tax=Caerostris extrusa TaxID=172846 RepID=A0AAV4YAW7_CAEEX|nr:hypothetical protein CEXT_809311 [Caerostris extrusa]